MSVTIIFVFVRIQNMEKLIVLLMCILLLGCTQKQDVSQQLAYSNYTDTYLSFRYPNWPTAANADPNFLVKNNGSCVFAAAKYPNMPIKLFQNHLENQFGSSFGGTGNEYLDYSFTSNGTQFLARSRVFYCNYDTYSITFACSGSLPSDTSVLSSASCYKRNLTTMPKLAMIPTPSNDNVSGIVAAIKEARENGVDVLDWYLSWKTLDGNWTVSDYLMEPLAYEGRSAAMVEVIHTTVLPEYPRGYKSFDDPGFKDDFADFSAEFVKRYKPDYYFVGGEVDDYLYNHRDKIPAFKEILHVTREKVKQANPTTKFGFVVTYHDALTHNATDIAKTLAPEADLIAYTSYGYTGAFVFDNISRGVSYLNGVRDIVPGKSYAILETGWSSSARLNSSEEKQAEFVREYFTFINSTDAEFVKWWGIHDGKNCTESAKSFMTEMPWLENDASFMVPFTEYMCSLGLKHSDGTPKKAWGVWQSNT